MSDLNYTKVEQEILARASFEKKKVLNSEKAKIYIFFINSVINTIGSNLTIHTIFDSEELMNEYFNHKLD